jgi:predicted nuclease with TOPRIM domain
MSNIEEMEKVIPQISIIINEARKSKEQNLVNMGTEISCFMEHCINSLKDLHEENTKLQSEVAKHSEYIKNLKKEIKELKNENNL